VNGFNVVSHGFIAIREWLSYML